MDGQCGIFYQWFLKAYTIGSLGDEHVYGTGDTPLLLLTLVLLRVLRFLPTIPLLGGGMPPMTLGSDNQQSNLKSK